MYQGVTVCQQVNGGEVNPLEFAQRLTIQSPLPFQRLSESLIVAGGGNSDKNGASPRIHRINSRYSYL
jgi:hypothetical protein